MCVSVRWCFIELEMYGKTSLSFGVRSSEFLGEDPPPLARGLVCPEGPGGAVPTIENRPIRRTTKISNIL